MKMLDTAIHYLSGKPCSAMEMRHMLYNQYGDTQANRKSIEQTLDYLISNQLISDVRLAKHLAFDYAHKGNQFILRLLQQRLIDEQLINEIILSLPDEVSRAHQEAQKKLASVSSSIKTRETQSMLMRFLTGRQFSSMVVAEVIEKLSKPKLHQLKAFLAGLRINQQRLETIRSV